MRKPEDEPPTPEVALGLLARLIAEEVRQGRTPTDAQEDRSRVVITCVPAPRRARK